MEIQVTFLRQGIVGIGEPCGVGYLVGVHFLKDLAYLLPLCNEDTSPVTPALMNVNILFLLQKYYLM
ncbi:hypothetical protein HanRHA438_Chr08g0358171 [Helianthus annuus]|uniref:Uncharacterized protein n=1 Tax=Helianthus annuus TaxID=4232 RepID=A0A251U8G2_HELAN|nr:hypothetical protein HanXRQr2_Chr08g0345901 [Helianthus annuus]KAJ0547544.1 hypothetical protein HanIR_Chr08g0373371 [Helianthus annuus]KAJ0554106.1 hypothetical protein HanHA89_Chr08g0303931 [Helianthus annuus]KAJ0719712.1 hypothetical protein HanLR1_Chr08g0284771 [Helianthus annuus]KAJ0722938.1 hypothetical protein HanOQP8_Chr08g0292281 [Helianthus annuus]